MWIAYNNYYFECNRWMGSTVKDSLTHHSRLPRPGICLLFLFLSVFCFVLFALSYYTGNSHLPVWEIDSPFESETWFSVLTDVHPKLFFYFQSPKTHTHTQSALPYPSCGYASRPKQTYYQDCLDIPGSGTLSVSRASSSRSPGSFFFSLTSER